MGEKRDRDEVLAFSAGIYESLWKWCDEQMELLRRLCGTVKIVKEIVNTSEMLSVLDLCVTKDGQLWSTKDGDLCQNLSWTPEEAIAYIVGKMLDPEVREKITTSLIDWA